MMSILNGTISPSLDKDLHDILESSPNMNESLNAVHSGSNSPPVPAFACSFPTGMTPIGRQQAVPSTLPLGAGPGTIGDPSHTVPIPLSDPNSPAHSVNSQVLKSPQSKIDSIRQWSISTYKCTKQIISEKLGKTSRTVDAELEAQIEVLRDTQRRYSTILRLARALSSHFYHVVQTQSQLGDVFADLAQKSPDLTEEFTYNAETQRALCKNGDSLLGALNFFVSSVNTLCNKTMEDTLLTVRQYETARVEYDAYRADLEVLSQAPRTDQSAQRLEEAQRNFVQNKERFDRLRADLSVKLKFLQENKVKVMHKQLLLFHNAVSAYFSGNNQQLETTLKQFNIRLTSPNVSSPSWLEQQQQ